MGLFGNDKPIWLVEVNGTTQLDIEGSYLRAYLKFDAVLKCERTGGDYSQTIVLDDLSTTAYIVDKSEHATEYSFLKMCEHYIVNGGDLNVKIKEQIVKYLKFKMQYEKEKVSREELKALIKNPIELNISFNTKHDNLF